MHMTSINTWMRSKAKVLLAVICALLMVGWFIIPALSRDMESRGLPDGKAFDKKIKGEYIMSLANGLRFLMPRQEADEYATIGQAWQLAILEEEARRHGISVAQQEVDEFVSQIAAQWGANYDEFLKTTRQTRSGFESTVRAYLSAVRLLQSVRDSVTMTPEEAWAWYSQQNERAKAEYVQVRAADLAPLMKIDEQALAAFYARHAEIDPQRDPNGVGYLTPEMVRVEYILAPYKQFESQANVTDAQVAEYYEKNKSEFRVEQAQPAAEGAEKPAEAPVRPLTEVAEQIKTRLVRQETERLADAAMKQANDEIWKQLDVPFGSQEIKSAKLQPIAANFNLVYRDTPLFTADEAAAVLPGATDLREKAFGQSMASIGRPSGILKAEEGKYIFQTLDIQAPRATPLAEIRPRVEQDFRMQAAMDAATEIVNKARTGATAMDEAEARVQAEIAQLIQSAQPTQEGVSKDPKSYYKRATTDFFGRPQEFWGMKMLYGQGLPEAQYNFANFGEAVFATRNGEIAVAEESSGARAAYLVTRADTQPASRTEFESNQAQVTPRLLQEKQMVVTDTWLKDLRRRAQPSSEAMKFLSHLPEWAS